MIYFWNRDLGNLITKSPKLMFINFQKEQLKMKVTTTRSGRLSNKVVNYDEEAANEQQQVGSSEIKVSARFQ